MAIYVMDGEIRDPNFVIMNDMEPGQAGIVAEGDHKGCLVLRTSSITNFEVMNLTESGPGRCWSGASYLKVMLLEKPVTIKIDGKALK